MKLKHNTSRRGKPASLLSALTGKWGKRHRLPAHVTGEKDWEVEVPQIHMSRAFAVMLVLFIVGVGGLFAFQMFGKEDKKTSSAPAEQGASSLAALEVSGSPGWYAGVCQQRRRRGAGTMDAMGIWRLPYAPQHILGAPLG